MFESYVLLKTLHVLLIATWLGMDFGTFISYKRMRDSSLSMETRKQMHRMFAFIDMGPRSSLVLMLTLGVALTYMGGWGFSGSGGRAFAVVTAIVGVFLVRRNVASVLGARGATGYAAPGTACQGAEGVPSPRHLAQGGAGRRAGHCRGAVAGRW